MLPQLECQVRGCYILVPVGEFMCIGHWMRLPRRMRRALVWHYLLTPDPSPKGMAAADAAVTYFTPW